MGVVFLTLGRLGVLDLAARAFPRALIRGVQLTVGLLFLKIAWGLVTDPPRGFTEHALRAEWAVPLAVTVVVLAFALRSRLITIAFVVVGIVTTALLAGSQVELGPSALSLPTVDAATLLTAFTVLVLPQIPLSFANSCLATADAARTYFGRAAERVRPGLLATTFGSANLLAGAVSGMPVCHGAGGLTAHVAFGARTGGAPVAMGIALLSLALGLGAGLASLLPRSRSPSWPACSPRPASCTSASFATCEGPGTGRSRSPSAPSDSRPTSPSPLPSASRSGGCRSAPSGSGLRPRARVARHRGAPYDSGLRSHPSNLIRLVPAKGVQ